MHDIQREHLGILDRAVIGILLFFMILLLGIQIAKASPAEPAVQQPVTRFIAVP